MKPNVLFITVDQMRGDCLSILGHPTVQTPNLDKLAEDGVLFRNAYSATPTCIPARAALLTGMDQRSHGRVGYEEHIPWTYEHTLPGELAKAGYHTQCIGKMHVYPTRSLCGYHNVVLHDGYMHYNRYNDRTMRAEHFNECDDYLNWIRNTDGESTYDLMDNGLDCNASTVALPWHLEERLHPTNWAVTQSIDFLRRRDPSKPFYLCTSFVRPHPPFDPPQAYFDMYLNEDMPDSPVGDWVDLHMAENGSGDPTTRLSKLSKKRLDRAKAAYFALITHLDFQIGRLLNALNEYGVLHNTVVVFTSDHGELLGDHHFFRKSLAYEGSAKVPLIVADYTGGLGLSRGAKEDKVVELRDIMPTLLDAVGAIIPESVDGESLLPLCRNEPNVTWREYVHGEHAYGTLSHHYVTNGLMKYIWYSQSGEEQLFDLASDPSELHNKVDEPASLATLQLWRERLIRELTDREEGYVQDGKLVIGQQPQTVLSHLIKA
ncbi:arylsulfatase A-like enzyme [Paenibacillus castaneae]|uniref:arylsulfatase n=1 Tax=Paenibacillus castaneae TaxID=474957 RepID=UPI000C9AE66C|nr:arylsulfatase [Paenibacillus castaneae]NIK80270.1 arylsulfatase A-like enzyme [Paenibacillus castaneae]